MRVVGLLLVVAPLLGTAACTSTSGLPQAPLNPDVSSVSYTKQYPIQAGDTLSIRLLLNPELNEVVMVRPDGHISTTVVPDMVAAGRTPLQLTAALVQGYRKDIDKPRITVEVQAIAPTHVYVAGEVPSPGEFTSTTGSQISLTQALARAGGMKPSGDGKAVFIIRRQEPYAAPIFLAVRYSDVIKATDPTADVNLAPYDVVYVPKTGIAEVYAFYQAYLGQFANPNFNFSYLLNPTPNTNVVPVR